MSDEHIVLAVDPGRDKCGVAVVERDGKVLFKKVILRSELAAVVQTQALRHNITVVVLGDGTTSSAALAVLSGIRVDGQMLSVIQVDEYRSTDEARKRYWRENPPKGFMKLIPVTMQVPPVPVDDYVAVILAERYFRGK